jgi:hypothetical protein
VVQKGRGPSAPAAQNLAASAQDDRRAVLNRLEMPETRSAEWSG